MDYDPQLCYKTDNVSFVSKENIVGYKQSTPIGAAAATAAAVNDILSAPRLRY